MVLKTKVSLLLIFPLVFITIANGILLYLSGQPRMVLANILILLGVLMAVKIFIQDSMESTLKKLTELGKKSETIEYSSKLLVQELNQPPVKRDDLVSLQHDLEELKENIPNLSSLTISQDLKSLLVLTLQEAEKAGVNGKGYIIIAKDIARLCSEVNASLLCMKDKTDEASRITLLLEEKITNIQFLLDTEQTLIIAEGIEAQARRLYSSLPDFKIHEKQNELVGRAPFETAVLRKAIRKKAA